MIPFFYGSLWPVFEDHVEDGRTGSQQRLQCEADKMKDSLKQYLMDNRKSIAEMRKQEKKLENSSEAQHKTKRQKLSQTGGPDPFLNHNIERRLWIAHDFALDLFKIIHTGVLNTSPFQSEPGCKDYSATCELKDISFLLSVLSRVPPCPGRTTRWMGDTALRFPKAHLPPEGSAPDSEHDKVRELEPHSPDSEVCGLLV